MLHRVSITHELTWSLTRGGAGKLFFKTENACQAPCWWEGNAEPPYESNQPLFIDMGVLPSKSDEPPPKRQGRPINNQELIKKGVPFSCSGCKAYRELCPGELLGYAVSPEERFRAREGDRTGSRARDFPFHRDPKKRSPFCHHLKHVAFAFHPNKGKPPLTSCNVQVYNVRIPVSADLFAPQHRGWLRHPRVFYYC